MAHLAYGAILGFIALVARVRLNLRPPGAWKRTESSRRVVPFIDLESDDWLPDTGSSARYSTVIPAKLLSIAEQF
jgi:hypothetical protein